MNLIRLPGNLTTPPWVGAGAGALNPKILTLYPPPLGGREEEGRATHLALPENSSSRSMMQSCLVKRLARDRKSCLERRVVCLGSRVVCIGSRVVCLGSRKMC